VLKGVMEALISNGTEGMRPVIERLFNEAMKIERARFLGANPWERNEDRAGHANGFKDKTIQTRIGALELKIPQVRGGLSFYPQSLERGCRSERALKLAIAEMYVTGVSTRKVTEITEALCGTEVSSTQVSRLSNVLDEELEKFRNRALAEYPYVILDARYEKVRHDGVVRDLAVLWATGINWDGRPEVLGVSVSLSEAEVHWKAFLSSLVKRGLSGIQLITSDDHEGLKAARKAVFAGVLWQRCQYHLAQNAQAYAPNRSMREEIAQAVRDIFNCSSLEEAQQMKQRIVQRYAKCASDFVVWLEENIDEGLTVFQFPRSHRRKIRTSNLLERHNREIKRRTRVATLFPHPASCLRLVTAVLAEIHEEWLTGKRYLDMNELMDFRETAQSQSRKVA
jgi:transposase-like protein